MKKNLLLAVSIISLAFTQLFFQAQAAQLAQQAVPDEPAALTHQVPPLRQLTLEATAHMYKTGKLDKRPCLQHKDAPSRSKERVCYRDLPKDSQLNLYNMMLHQNPGVALGCLTICWQDMPRRLML
jgi:hypothetical protein